MRYDSIIIGTGPAGMQAALQLTARKKSFLLFGSPAGSQKVSRAHKINNYLGLPHISGEDLNTAFLAHLQDQGIFITAGKINAVYKMGDYFSVAMAQDMFESSTLILATGVHSAKHLPGEDQLLGRGVSYCASCDAMFYREKTIAVVLGSDEFWHEVEFLAEVAKTVYVLPLRRTVHGSHGNITVLDDKPTAVLGEKTATGLQLSNSTLEVDGVFILRENLAPSSLVPGIQTENSHIWVDSKMATNLSGCFAAGDCVGPPYQYIRAAGQGLSAAHSVVEYLEQK